MRNTTLDKRCPSLNFRHPARVKGMPEIQSKRFLWIAFHRFPLSIDKITLSLTIFFDFDFYLLVTPERGTEVILKGRQI